MDVQPRGEVVRHGRLTQAHVLAEGDVVVGLRQGPLEQQLDGVAVGLKDRKRQIIIPPVRRAPGLSEPVRSLQQRPTDVLWSFRLPADVDTAGIVGVEQWREWVTVGQRELFWEQKAWAIVATPANRQQRSGDDDGC